MAYVKIKNSLTGSLLDTDCGLLGVMILMLETCHCSTQALYNKDRCF